ncbi:MAG: holo-ACP synthase [Chloroflexi bacterium]|nr:holo-ACP synthase [Chloroflexota bacterium]
MNLSTGVDIVEVGRIRDAMDRHGERFVARIFTGAEQQECGARVESFAARFAAKEAAAKALGCGIGDVSWLDIEVRGDENRTPHLYLSGAAEIKAKEKRLTSWSVSLSHTKSQAIAFVVAIG